MPRSLANPGGSVKMRPNEAQEHLLAGGTVTSPIESSGVTTPIVGEPDILV